MASRLQGVSEPPPAAVSGADFDPAVLEAEIDRATDAFNVGRPAAAARMLRSVRRRASRLGSDPRALAIVARTFLSEAAPHFDMTGDLGGALALVDRAEELADQVGSRMLTVKVIGQRALLALRSGDTGTALSLFDAAVALLDGATPQDQARTMLNRAVVHLERADLAHAESDLRRGVAYADRAGDARLGAMTRHNLGYVEFLAGRIPRALAAFEEAARTNPGGAHPTMRLDHARALREAGLVREADTILAEAATRLEDARLLQDLGETELVRAECALGEGEPRLGRSFAASARRRFVRRGNLRWQRRAELLLLQCEGAALEEREGRGRRRALLSVATRAAELAAACRAERRPDLARLAELLEADCRLRAGTAATTLPRVRRLDPLSTRLQVRAVRALAAARDGDATGALAEVRTGLTELGSYQSQLGSLDLRTAGGLHGVALARVGLWTALERGDAAGVLTTVEHSRAISSRLPLVRPPSDTTTARLLGELRKVEDEARELAGDPDAQDQAGRLRGRAARLQQEIRSRAWELETDSARAHVAPRLSQVRAAVRAEGAVFVSYAQHQGTWLAVVVRPAGARIFELGPTVPVADLVRRVRADLDALALPQLPAPIRTTVLRSLGSCLRRLDGMLLRPLAVNGEALVLSCSGPLAVLPWSLLPSRSGLPTVVTPAAATWLRARTSAPRSPQPKVVAVAGPGLHRSRDEAVEVSRTWQDSDLLVGDEATTDATRSALARADVLHVAAHGQHRADSPLFSSLGLADGSLYVYELDAEDGAAGCVTLSACEAGLATLRPGDEGLGLTHVLLQLGSRSVVAGTARVRDDVAAETMTRVHAGMAAGLDSATALAQAQLAADPEAAPAPFVCFGGTW